MRMSRLLQAIGSADILIAQLRSSEQDVAFLADRQALLRCTSKIALSISSAVSKVMMLVFHRLSSCPEGLAEHKFMSAQTSDILGSARGKHIPRSDRHLSLQDIALVPTRVFKHAEAVDIENPNHKRLVEVFRNAVDESLDAGKLSTNRCTINENHIC